MSGSGITFSVVIPAYNAAGTIVATIASCLNQSEAPLEIIVVDDGSSDATAALIQEHFSGQVIYHKLPQNGGPSVARNVGIGLAKGTHIAFQDADDVWHLDKLKIVKQVFERQPDIHFLYHPYTLKPVDFEVDATQQEAAPYPFSKLLWSNPIGTPCVVIQKHAGLRFNEQMHYMEDYDLWLREGYKHGIYFLNLLLTRVNRPILSTGGQSGNGWKMRRGELTAYWHLPRLNVAYALLVPVLVAGGLLKHFIKSFRPPRSNY